MDPDKITLGTLIVLKDGGEIIYCSPSPGVHTALGDFPATTLALGYLSSVVLFAVAIVVPAIAWRLGLNAVVAFWWAYVLTRPLGASVADYFSKAPSLSGFGFGDGRTTAVATLAVLVGVTWLY